MTGVATVCVDIGNSGMRCVLIPHEPRADAQTPWPGELLRVDWPTAHDGSAITTVIEQSVGPWLEAVVMPLHPSLNQPVRWRVSSVQRTMESHLRSFVDRFVLGNSARSTLPDYHLVTYRDLPMQVQVDHPEKVGIDRLLAVLAAAHHAPGRPLIVIQAGSAITVDWFEPPCRYCGGAIMPGVPMMLRLLSQAADLLPEVAAKELLNLPPLPGKNTSAAMNAGASSAVVGGVQHLVARYREQFGRDTLVVMSGGDGPLLSPHLSEPIKIIDHLVLRGLALL